MWHQSERRKKRDSPGSILAEMSLEFVPALLEPLGVPFLVAVAVVFGVAWLLRWLIDQMISRG